MQTVLHITGCLEFSDPERTIKNCFGNALQSAVQHNLDHEVLSSEEVNKRFPGYHLPPQYKVLLPILLRSLPAVRDVTLTDRNCIRLSECRNGQDDADWGLKMHAQAAAC